MAEIGTLSVAVHSCAERRGKILPGQLIAWCTTCLPVAVVILRAKKKYTYIVILIFSLEYRSLVPKP